MDSVIYARVAEIQMPSFPNIVSLSDADPIEGIVMLDFISVVSVRDFTKGSLNPLGPVTDATLRAVDEALRVVLGITP
jgi:mRNA-degrading endonuclease toxin of MazEF toxin-antitoxin module